MILERRYLVWETEAGEKGRIEFKTTFDREGRMIARTTEEVTIPAGAMLFYKVEREEEKF